MTKGELIKRVAAATGKAAADVSKVLDAVLDVIQNEVASGGSVKIVQFGTFHACRLGERTGKNPRTGATFTAPATTVVRFRPGAGFKHRVAGRGGSAAA